MMESAQENVGLRTQIKALKDHIVIMGSNDFSIELLSHELSRQYPEYSLSFSNVGSLEGLIALSRGNSHLAGCHLFDPDTGEYNFPYVSRYLPDMNSVVVNLIYRDNGLMVRSGNPLHIRGMEDLARPGIKIINRQQGSGTRILLDFELKAAGISPGQIEGYEREVTTHVEVAMAILSGSADVGLGILSAARMLGLEFIHVTRERYDLVIPEEIISSPPISSLLEVIRSPEFEESINHMGGYDTKDTGKILEKR
jgi:putative molybdopterin biosynthesis protein